MFNTANYKAATAAVTAAATATNEANEAYKVAHEAAVPVDCDFLVMINGGYDTPEMIAAHAAYLAAIDAEEEAAKAVEAAEIEILEEQLAEGYGISKALVKHLPKLSYTVASAAKAVAY